ncbi:MAG: hypothetical protein AAF829_04675 [Pseudomonadota bacterium]
MRFDLAVAPGGYAWWYLDALSDDGQNGLTMIAFIGSVFSPYYAWSGRHDPLNHCSINVALYRPRAGRWAMTERGRQRVEATPDRFKVHNSALSWDGTKLTIDVHERCAPIPFPLRGRITVNVDGLVEEAFPLDDAKAHRWAPLNPNTDVQVDFSHPGLSWRGCGYLDSNQGAEPLEDGFRLWDWSRYDLGGGETAVLYNTEPRTGKGRSLALKFKPDGRAEAFTLPPTSKLPDTRIWRIPRPTRSDPGAAPRHIRTFEDTPFYARSLVQVPLLGAPRVGVYESFAGDRLRRQIVKAMLPFRMPRLAN